MKISIALQMTSESASHHEAAVAKVGRLKALIAKTKANPAYKTSERLKASVERRTQMIKDLTAKIRTLLGKVKTPAGKSAAKPKVSTKPKSASGAPTKVAKKPKPAAGAPKIPAKAKAPKGKADPHTGRKVIVHPVAVVKATKYTRDDLRDARQQVAALTADVASAKKFGALIAATVAEVKLSKAKERVAKIKKAGVLKPMK